MSQYLLQVEIATKRLIKSYEITEESHEMADIPAGREQVIITDTAKFNNAVQAAVDYKIKTNVFTFADFTTKEPLTTTGCSYINTVSGKSSVTGRDVIANCVYRWDDTSWDCSVPEPGDKRYLRSLNLIYKYDGTKWAEISGPLPKLEYEIKDNDIYWSVV